MESVVQKIITWATENRFNIESQDGTKYEAIDFDEMKAKFDEWLELDKKRVRELLSDHAF